MTIMMAGRGRLRHVLAAIRHSAASSGSSSDDDPPGEEDDEAALEAESEALARAAEIGFEIEFKEGDWRARRAEQLAGSPERWAEQLARCTNPAFKGVETWAHPLEEPEPGAVLLADAKMGHFQQHYFAQCVILLLEHGEQGSLGVILNRPTPFTVEGERVPAAFRDRGRISFGGDVQGSAMLHPVENLDGAKELLPGVFCGGSMAEAAMRVESKLQGVEDFRESSRKP